MAAKCLRITICRFTSPTTTVIAKAGFWTGVQLQKTINSYFIYFINSNAWGAANFVLQNNSALDNTPNGLHQLVVVPEPSIMLLWLCGIVTVYAARRRNRINRSEPLKQP
jgi:hypothetical protein